MERNGQVSEKKKIVIRSDDGGVGLHCVRSALLSFSRIASTSMDRFGSSRSPIDPSGAARLFEGCHHDSSVSYHQGQ